MTPSASISHILKILFLVFIKSCANVVGSVVGNKDKNSICRNKTRVCVE